MSHGSADKCEPNLVPLLDLVLQLIMFFMLCANFVMEQTSAEVKLPEAIAAKALEKEDNEVIFLNVGMVKKATADGGEREVPAMLLTPDQQAGGDVTYENAAQVKTFMAGRAAVEKRKTGKDALETVIVLRVDERVPFETTYSFMKVCRDVGYSKVQLRAIRHTGPE
jgi:biopolymer transport protein ExbD